MQITEPQIPSYGTYVKFTDRTNCTDNVDHFRFEKLTDRNLTFTDRYSAGVLDNPHLQTKYQKFDQVVDKMQFSILIGSRS